MKTQAVHFSLQDGVQFVQLGHAGNFLEQDDLTVGGLRSVIDQSGL